MTISRMTHSRTLAALAAMSLAAMRPRMRSASGEITSPPSTIAVALILVASDEATSGSVMQKAERIAPSSKGFSQRSFCSSEP